MTRFLGYTLLLVACKAWDLYSTWLRTSDLSRELNPVTRLLGSTWPALFVQTLVLLAAILWFVRKALEVDRSLQPAEPGLSISDFFGRLAFKELSPWWHLVYRTPTRRRATLYFLGSLILFGAPLAFLFAGASNWWLTRSTAYAGWFNAHLPWSVALVFAFSVLSSFLLFAGRDYSSYRRDHSPSTPAI